MTSVTIGEQSSTQPPLSTMNDDSSETAAQIIATNVVRDNQALAIVLPIALLSIAINVLLVGVGAYIYVFLKRKKETNGEERSHNHGKLEWPSKSIESAALMHNNTPSKGWVHFFLSL